MENQETSLIRSILRSEITWIITFIGITIGFFNMVVLPLNRMQLQLTQIQGDVSKQVSNYDQLQAQVSDIKTSVSVLKSRLDNLNKQ